MCSCQNKSIGKISKSMKHKKHHTKKRRSYSRVGAISTKEISSGVTTAAEVAVGILAGKIAANALGSSVSFLQTKFVGSAIRIIGGALLAGSKNRMIGAVGLGVAADGVVNLVTNDLAIKFPGMAGALPYKNVSGALPYKNVSGSVYAQPMLKHN